MQRVHIARKVVTVHLCTCQLQKEYHFNSDAGSLKPGSKSLALRFQHLVGSCFTLKPTSAQVLMILQDTMLRERANHSRSSGVQGIPKSHVQHRCSTRVWVQTQMLYTTHAHGNGNRHGTGALQTVTACNAEINARVQAPIEQHRMERKRKLFLTATVKPSASIHCILPPASFSKLT